MPQRRERRRATVNHQLELARAVQRSLLPMPLGALPRFELVARFAPAQVVAGDFYDYFQPTPELMGLYLGDVQGKGLEGAMYAALVSGIMRGLHKSSNPPARVLDFLNRRLRLRPIPDKFCTLGYAVLDVERRQLAYANAGLPFPLLCRGGRTRRIEVAGLPLGLFDEVTYEQQEVQLEPGDRVLFFTDGLVDSLENRRVRDGEAVVRGVLESASTASALALADHLVSRLPLPSARNRRRQLADDATFLLLRIL
ncbi:MAG: PP2C family protein-serine/threonine phosphatase [Terriglobia bacterium]